MFSAGFWNHDRCAVCAIRLSKKQKKSRILGTDRECSGRPRQTKRPKPAAQTKLKFRENVDKFRESLEKFWRVSKLHNHVVMESAPPFWYQVKNVIRKNRINFSKKNEILKAEHVPWSDYFLEMSVFSHLILWFLAKILWICLNKSYYTFLQKKTSNTLQIASKP